MADHAPCSAEANVTKRSLSWPVRPKNWLDRANEECTCSILIQKGATANQKLIKAIQTETNLRLIMPFGLNVRVGDVVSTGKDGEVTLEASAKSVLDIDVGLPREPAPGGDGYWLSNEGSSCRFRAKGEASTLFPDLPSAAVGVDIHFNSADGWVLAVVGRQLYSLEDVNRFREPILTAYRRKVWTPDWALVTSVSHRSKVQRPGGEVGQHQPGTVSRGHR